MGTVLLTWRWVSTRSLHSSWGNSLKWQANRWKILAFTGSCRVCGFEEHHLEQQSTWCLMDPLLMGRWWRGLARVCIFMSQFSQCKMSAGVCEDKSQPKEETKVSALIPLVNGSVIKCFSLLLSSLWNDIFATAAFSFQLVFRSETEWRRSLAEDEGVTHKLPLPALPTHDSTCQPHLCS